MINLKAVRTMVEDDCGLKAMRVKYNSSLTGDNDASTPDGVIVNRRFEIAVYKTMGVGMFYAKQDGKPVAIYQMDTLDALRSAVMQLRDLELQAIEDARSGALKPTRKRTMYSNPVAAFRRQPTSVKRPLTSLPAPIQRSAPVGAGVDNSNIDFGEELKKAMDKAAEYLEK